MGDSAPPVEAGQRGGRDAAVLTLVAGEAAKQPGACVTLQLQEERPDLEAEVIRRLHTQGITLSSPEQCTGAAAVVVRDVNWQGRTASVGVSRWPCVGSYTLKRRLGIFSWRVVRRVELCE